MKGYIVVNSREDFRTKEKTLLSRGYYWGTGKNEPLKDILYWAFPRIIILEHQASEPKRLYQTSYRNKDDCGKELSLSLEIDEDGNLI